MPGTRRRRGEGPREPKDWVGQLFLQAPFDHLGLFLGRVETALLEISSRTLQNSLRNIVRSRSEKLRKERRLANLEGHFCIHARFKDLLKREGKSVGGDIIGVGGDRQYHPLSRVMSLDLVTKRITTLAPITTPRHSHAAAVVGEGVFALGGFNSRCGGNLRTVEHLSLTTGHWTAVTPMREPRRCFGAVVFEGRIIVVGGLGGQPTQIMSGVESFDLGTGEWTDLAPLSMPRCYHGVVVSAQGKIFALGGSDHFRVSASVECFDLAMSAWKTIAPLTCARHKVGAAVLDNRLYAIGGRDEAGRLLSSVECLDLSVPDGQWTAVAPMTRPRCNFQALVVRGRIMVIGSETRQDYVRSIEYFDPKGGDGGLGQWTLDQTMTSEFAPFPAVGIVW